MIYKEGMTELENKLEAALRKSVTELKKVRNKLDELEKIQHEPIAIIGMSCRFPKSDSPEKYWDLLINGIEGISEVPKNRWNIEEFYDPDPDAPGKMMTRNGGFIDNFDLFDVDLFGISPREAQAMDPQQRLLLEVTWEALERAGIAPESLKNTQTGVFMASCINDYSSIICGLGFETFENHTAVGFVQNALNGRISYLLGLLGPSMTVDTACSSSLVSLHLACTSLQRGECNLAISGGVNLLLSPAVFIALSRAKMLSPDGHCKTFDASGDGYARGEGVGVVILKRMSDAVRDNDTILAVIRATSVNQDGPSSGLTVPNRVAQVQLIERALEVGKLQPTDVSYMEAHGTGTQLGDPIEVKGIQDAYGKGRDANHPLLLGSAKSNIGHLEGAAGIASVIKVILSLNHRVLPPNLHLKQLNPKINLEAIPAKIVTSPTPWDAPIRRAGISSFGFTGTNAHVILEEAPPLVIEAPERSSYLFTLSAISKEALESLIASYRDFLTNESMADVAYTANTGRNHFPYRIAIIAKDINELKEKLKPGSYEIFCPEIQKIEKKQFSDLSEARKAYIQGIPIDWKSLDGPRKKVILPTYAFQHQRYPVEKVTKKISGSSHPLLGGVIDLPYLKDHQVYGKVIFPGAGFLEMMASSAKMGKVKVSNVSIEAALQLKGLAETLVSMTPTENGYEVAIYSYKNAWVLHAKGTVAPIDEEAPRIDLESIRARCKTVLLKGEFYDYVNSTGIHYGEHFQTMVQLAVGKSEALGELRCTYPVGEYLAYPALLDGCFQSMVSSLKQRNIKSLYLPVGYDSFVLYKSLGDHVFAHWQETEFSEESVTGNLTLFNESGEVLGIVTGFHSRRATEQAVKQMLSAEDWFYQWKWQEEKLELVNPAGRWMVNGENNAIVEFIKSKGGQISDMDPDGIIHLASAGAESVLLWVQAMVLAQKKVPLILVTTTDLQNSPISGLFKTICLEHPELNMKLFEVEGDLDPKMLFSQSSESIIRLKGENAFVPRLLHIREAVDTTKELIKAGATYLITGGMGGLGFEIADWLIAKGAGHVVLTGRRVLDKPLANPSITYESLDISNESAVASLLKREFKGIFHLAGVLDDAILMNQDWAHFEKVFAPKVSGSYYLHQHSKNLDFFVMFSSIASTLGSSGQANYAAANAYMDALAEYRRKQGLPAQSLSWGPWAEVGMAKDLSARHAKGGLIAITPKEAIRAMETAMHMDIPHITIMNVRWTNYLKQMIEPPSWLQAFAERKGGSDNLISKLETAKPSERLELVKKYVENVVKTVLQLSSVEEKRGFFDLGMDSLMAVELKNQLQEGLGKAVILGPTVVFDHSNIEKMTNHLAHELKIESVKEKKVEPIFEATQPDEPIAIIGMGCRFPGGANNPEAYWKLLAEGKDAISEIPKDRWDADKYYDPDPTVPGKMNSKLGGFLDIDVSMFDATYFHMNPKEAKYTDPQQRLLLEVTHEAIESAGIAPASLYGTPTGVYVGIWRCDYSDLITETGNVDLINRYSRGTLTGFAAGRLSYFFGLQGPSVAIDTACSSATVAISDACQNLLNGDCNLALAGGVNLLLSPHMSIATAQAGLLAADGHCKCFDAAADGYIRGEGCGMIVLERLSDAVRNGHNVLAVIKSAGVNHGGASSGPTVPNAEAQEILIRRVLARAKLKAEDIDYVEAMSTGTPIGDPIEVSALGAVYGQRDAAHPFKMASVKTNIGHLESASGIASVIKVILALQHEQLPAHINLKKINPAINLNFPVEIVTSIQPWTKGERIRRAAINSFGVSGTNAHLILEEGTGDYRKMASPSQQFQRKRYWVDLTKK